jgi:hypothetical protein
MSGTPAYPQPFRAALAEKRGGADADSLSDGATLASADDRALDEKAGLGLGGALSAPPSPPPAIRVDLAGVGAHRAGARYGPSNADAAAAATPFDRLSAAGSSFSGGSSFAPPSRAPSPYARFDARYNDVRVPRAFQ